MKRSTLEVPPGVLPDKEVGGGGGGLDLTSNLEAKFGARSGQFHQIREKIWEVLSPQNAKVPILGSYLKFRGQNLGYLSLILLEAKSGVPTRI